jgi:prepilin-type processing-associated H-X9-DG protein/prepilin-type N-terminal cleavage/methylation domain-containing protein
MRRRCAFTLVELLVVIGVIALLIGILLPALNRARASGRQVKCLSNLRQLAVVDRIYETEFKGSLVPGYWGWSASTPPWPPNNPPPIPASGPRRYWFQVPQMTATFRAVNNRFPRAAVCPDAPLSEERATKDGLTIHNSYGQNYTQLPGLAVALAPHYVNAWKANQVVQPAEKVRYCDATSEGVSVSASAVPNATMKYFDPYYGERHEAPDKANIVAYRHRRGANVLYFDGHAQWVAMDGLLYDPGKAQTLRNRRQWEPKTK